MDSVELKKMFGCVIDSLPEDMRLPRQDLDIIAERFANEVNEPLKEAMMSMVRKASSNGELSEDDQQEFIKKLMRLFIPYVSRSVEEG